MRLSEKFLLKRIVMVFLLPVLLIGCVIPSLTSCDREDLLTQKEKELRAMRSTREWRTNSQGIRYFHTCIEGHKFFATHSRHGFIQLAGPIGECND
jgi:hypothetical protein